MARFKKIIILAVIIVVVVIGWTALGGKKDTSTSLLSESGTQSVLPGASGEPNNDEVGKEFLTLLLNLRTIKLDTTVFDRRSFKELRDFTKVLPPQTDVGRPNPFAPIGTDEVPVTTTAPVVSGTTQTGSAILSGGPASPVVITPAPSSATVIVETREASSLGRTSALLNGALLKTSATTVRFFEWGISPDSLSASTPEKIQKTSGIFNQTVSGLTSNTSYYFRAVAVTGASRVEGDVVTFTTLP